MTTKDDGSGGKPPRSLAPRDRRKAEIAPSHIAERELLPQLRTPREGSLVREEDELLERQARSDDPVEQAILRQRRSLLKEERSQLAQERKELEALHGLVRAQHYDFQRGEHPQEEELLQVAEILGIAPGELHRDTDAFALVLYKFAYEYAFVAKANRRIKNRYLAAYAVYERGSGDMREAIDFLAHKRGIDLSKLDGEDRFRAFVSLAKSEEDLAILCEALPAPHLRKQLDEARRREAQALADARSRLQEVERFEADLRHGERMLHRTDSERRSLERMLERMRELYWAAEKEAEERGRQVREFEERIRDRESRGEAGGP